MLVGIQGLFVLGRVVVASALAFAPAPEDPVPPETSPRPGKPAEPDTLQADPPTEPDEASAEPVEPDEVPAEPVDPDETPAEPVEPDPAAADEQAAEPKPAQADEDPAQAEPDQAEPDQAEPEPVAVGVETPPPRPSRATAARGDLLRAGLLGGGAAAMLVGAGAAAAMIWALSEREAEEDAAQTVRERPYLQLADPGRRDRMHNIAIGTGVAAGAYLLTGAVLVGFGARLERPRTWGLSPSASRRGGGLLLRGRF